MHNYYKALLESLDDTVPNHTYAAVFTMAVVMGLMTVSGLLFTPTEPHKVAERIKQKILHAKDITQRDRIYRPLLPVPMAQGAEMPEMDYGAYIAGIERTQPLDAPVRIQPRETDRAAIFSRQKRSEQHWAMLKDSLKKPALPKLKTPVVLPPSIMIGSVD